MEKKLNFSAFIDTNSIEILNTEFKKAKCYVMYYDENPNGSDMSKEAVEEALSSIYNIPIIGEYKETIEDFGTHGGKIEISDDGIKYIQTTRPYGLVPESCSPRWEMVKDENGAEKEYLVVDGILWYGRYSTELQTAIEEKKPQSMEINIIDGEFTDKGTYKINKFEFSALCILGSDVQPCFSEAKIVTYGLDEFKTNLDEMMKQYKHFTSVEEPEVKSEKVVSIYATANQKREALNNALDNETIIDDDGNCISDTWYWVQDFDDQYVFVEKSIWTLDNYDCQNGRFTYSFDESSMVATVDKSSWTKMIKVWLTEEENKKVQDERSQQDAEFAALKEEVVSLREFKASQEFAETKEETETLLAGFENALGDNTEFVAIKASIETAFDKNEILYNVADLEKDLYALLGKAKYQINKPKRTERINSYVSIPTDQRDEFGSAEKYLKK